MATDVKTLAEAPKVDRPQARRIAKMLNRVRYPGQRFEVLREVGGFVVALQQKTLLGEITAGYIKL